ncbi:substrate-binding domain-containing protein [Antarcticirhabdus aurantiaca]|uniref:PhnD/SsuA/transferrin family substrate-binding protein n=1 Tax=Antarcticirhabdus aurantiaca TaxID=2606717 RepID=A0ACD4NIW6_9HYPH|nr:PhnD/SsuA/transferrin family substrate-binding protein [Antarcticirhabdus aurantiaca]WAJ26656.1 PhnD/SsuA/transferrin family substrate-binding protein [Jeongeuplla avenae]
MLPHVSRTGHTRREVIGALGTGLAALACPTDLKAGTPLTVGLTPVFLNSDLALLDGLRTYLKESTGSDVQLVMRRTYQEVTALVLARQLDAAWICGFPYVRHREALHLLGVPLWRGRPLYRSYLIVRSDRTVADWHGTRGDIHAFSDPDSNSGYLATAALLAGSGMGIGEFFRSSFYTYGHRNVVRAVAAGLAQSGSVDGYVWEVLREIEPEMTIQTRVIRASDWQGFPPIVCAAGDAASPRADRIRSALLAMASGNAGRSVLDMLRIDGFVAEPPALYDSIAAEVDLVDARS